MINSNFKINFPSVIVLILGLLVGSALCWILMFLFENYFQIDTARSGGFMMLTYAVSMIAPIVAFEIFIKKYQSKQLRFDFSTKPFRVYLMVFPLMFGMMLMSDVIVQQIPTDGDVFGPIYKMFQQQMSALSFDNVSMIILTVVMAPILEEILFRGILQKGMINNGMKPWVAIIISSFIFGLIHGYPWQFVGAGLLGLVLGLVYHKTKSLLIVILLHAFNNLLSALFMMYSDVEHFSEILNMKNVYVFMLGLFVFAISFYFFAIKKNIVYKE